ncbi:hypothetical protein AB1285_21625 [Microbacterium sp. NRRL B-14842]|uniref:DUF7507 domain-containing protein n=1 Tax=Microbacterium sp. NRRL B-14842 TaxID=3162881 RepID=UPI003D28FBA7
MDDTDFSGEGELSAVTCPDEAARIIPGQTVTCTATYTTTQADVDSGRLTNTATATATPPTGTPPVSPPSTVEVPFDGTNSLAIEKRATTVDVNANRIIDLGDRVEWTIIVTNTGAQTVSDIAVSDPDGRCGHLPGDEPRLRGADDMHGAPRTPSTPRTCVAARCETSRR